VRGEQRARAGEHVEVVDVRSAAGAQSLSVELLALIVGKL
jgi:hypothetical protein